MGCNCAMTARPFSVGGVDKVARIHLPQADAAADGRGDARVDQIQFCAIDSGLRRFNGGIVGFDGTANLIGGGQLGIELLLGDDLLFEEFLIAHIVHLGVAQERPHLWPAFPSPAPNCRSPDRAQLETDAGRVRASRSP